MNISGQVNSEIFSIMKALGIIFVVAGHAFYMPVTNFVSLFHLAIFYFVAGYFFSDKYTANKLDFFYKRVKNLWLPLIGYGLVFLALHNLFFRLHIYSDVYGFFENVDYLYTKADYIQRSKSLLLGNINSGVLLGPMWFIQSIFITSMLFCGGLWITKLITKRYIEIMFGGGILILACTCYYLLPDIEQFSTTVNNVCHRDLVLLPIMYAGRLFRLYQHKVPINPYILTGCFLVLISFQLGGMRVDVVKGEFFSLPLYYGVSLIGCYFAYQAAYYLQRITTVRQLFVYIGKVTFEIMALHSLSFKVISLLQIWIYGYDINYLSMFPVIEIHSALWWGPYTLCGVSLPLIYCYMKKLLKVRTQQWYNSFAPRTVMGENDIAA